MNEPGGWPCPDINPGIPDDGIKRQPDTISRHIPEHRHQGAFQNRVGEHVVNGHFGKGAKDINRNNEEQGNTEESRRSSVLV